MAYSRIDRKVWYSRTFKKLEQNAKFLWFYLLSNPHGNSAGYYVLTPAYAADDLGWPIKRYTDCLKQICEIKTTNGHKGLAAYDEECQVLWIRNYLEVHPILNKKHLAGLKKALEIVPVSPLLISFESYLKTSSNTYHKQLAKTLGIIVQNTTINTNIYTNIETNIDTKENENEKENYINIPSGYLSAQNSADDAKKTKDIKIYPPCPHEKIVGLYEKICHPPMPKVESWGKSQKAQLVKRWRFVIDQIQKETEMDDMLIDLNSNQIIYVDWWNDFFKYLTESNWLMGRTKEKWVADLQWILGGKGWPRILNGRYHTKAQHSKVKDWIEHKAKQMQDDDIPF
jgi:hypothetical protein